MRNLIIILFYVALACSCSKSEDVFVTSIELNQHDITVDYDASEKLTAVISPSGTVPPKMNWSSSKPEIASVDTLGKVKGLRVGESTIMVMSADRTMSDTCHVTVKATNFLYKEPVGEFGMSITQIKQKETRSLFSEDEEGIVYEGENASVLYIMYLFEDGKFNSCGIILKEDSYTATQASLFLKQRYEYIGQESNVFYFKGEKVNIGLTQNATLGLVVLYLPLSSTGGRLANTNYIDRFGELVQ